MKQTEAQVIPLFSSQVSAGFPSPADDYVEVGLDLNQHLVPNPPATFFVRVQGDSMKEAGIFAGDLLIIDRSREAKNGSIILAILNGEYTVKRFFKKKDHVLLVPENKNYKPFVVTEDMDFQVWGIVAHVIRSFV